MAAHERKRAVGTASGAGLADEIGKRSPFESPQQEAFLNLVRTSSRLAEPFDRLFKSFGLSQPLYNMLRILRGHHLADDGTGESESAASGLSVHQIAGQMLTREPDMTRLIDRLVKLGAVERRRSETDRRVVLVCLTEEGLGLTERVTPAVQRLHREQFAGLSEKDLGELNRLLVAARDRGTGTQ